MTITGVNSNVVIPLLRGNGVSADIASAELIRQQQDQVKNASNQDKYSKLVNDSSVYSNPEAAYARPQYQRTAPVAPSEGTSKQYFNSVKNSDDDLAIEEAEYYVDDEEGFPEDYDFPKNIYEPKGYYITLSPEYLAANSSRRQISAADALKQKFYADQVRTGSLINVVM